MAAPLTPDELVALVRKSELIEAERLDALLDGLRADADGELPPPTELSRRMVEGGLLTNFQSEQLLQGKWRGFTIGKFRVLESLGRGGMGCVYLCEHQHMGHRVAVKVLPVAKANDPAALGRFYREARAAGTLDHPNLVRAYDIDQDGDLHYLVMDYVDGVNLQRLVARTTGPLAVARACNYIWQVAHGLDHAFRCGLVHRDIKPANILLDRQGGIRLLDLGLARFYEDNQDLLTIKYDDNNVLGTADYVSPEQAHDSHDVDIRTDIYSLGASFYFCLTGQPLFPEGKVAQKLIWHQTRQPTPVTNLCPDLPPEVAAIVEKMLAKKPEERYQTPAEVIAALEPWARQDVPLPTEEEIPPLSPAARQGMGSGSDSGARTPSPRPVRADGRPVPPQPTRRFTRQMAPVRVSASAGEASSLVKTPGPVAGGSHPPLAGTDNATPRLLAGEMSTARANPAVEPAAVAAPPAAPPRRRPARALLLALLLIASTGTGVALRLGLRGQSASPEQGKEPGAVLVVSRSGATGTFPSIRVALDRARPGDRIEVRDPVWQEVLRLDSGRGLGRGVVIQGAAPEGATVWRVPAGQGDGSLLHLSAVAGLTVRNFTLDGRDSAQHLVTLSGPCPGLTLEDVRLRGFRTSAVHLTNCTGDEANPVQLRRLQIAPTREAEAALLLEAYPDQACRRLRVSDCRLEGPGRAGVLIAGPVEGVELNDNRFTRFGDGVLCRKVVPQYSVGLALTGNTFTDIQGAALHFETTPPVEGSRVTLSRNRVLRTPFLGRTDGFRTEPVRTPAQWVWGESPAAQAGGKTPRLYFRKRFTLESTPTRAVLSITCADSCIVWLNGQCVGEAKFEGATRRVRAFDVARFLIQGDNVLAVEGSGRAGAAGLLAELDDNASGIFTRTLTSDAAWKTTLRPGPGWQGRDFDDASWSPARVLPLSGGPAEWRDLIWEAVVQEHFKYQAAKVIPPPSGNERDARAREGFPPFDAAVVPPGK